MRKTGRYKPVGDGEKRQLLAAEGKPWPNCKCHGVPKQWSAGSAYRAGGGWRCRVTKRLKSRRWEHTYREQSICWWCCKASADWDASRFCQVCQNIVNARKVQQTIDKYQHLLSLDRDDPEYVEIVQGRSVNA